MQIDLKRNYASYLSKAKKALAVGFVSSVMLNLPVSGVAAHDVPERITTIGSTLTEIVHALGDGEKIVAVDSTSTFPASVKDLPNLGYFRSLNAEGVLATNADLYLLREGAGPSPAMDLLKASGVEMIAFEEGFDLAAITSKIERIAKKLHREEKAEKLIKTVSAQMEAAIEKANAHDKKPRVLFALTLSNGRLTVSGRGTAADAMIGYAGGINPMQQFEGYKPVSKEAVLEAKPDIIVMMAHLAHKSKDQILGYEPIAASPAGQNKRVVVMGAAYLLGFGPRTPAAINDLAAEFHK
ncbi:heme/hemin ABC transporter substrate-binding protein [Polycladidibacter hongkongensis]|uniref:heme/hemin ABC transporter substrate-binding protein n=1 Tax=Polycladidibacter hongkongensis TaxID=1647556 RepID=UPI00082D4533|nr:ABC transporter substrate-binding protein [Pseudovibrio hongkongensis]